MPHTDTYTYTKAEIENYLIDVMGYSRDELKGISYEELNTWVDSDEGLQNYTFADTSTN